MMTAFAFTIGNLRADVRRFLRDNNGSMSIELVVVLPLLLFLTTGGLAFWNAFNSNSRTAKVAYTVADIMSRYTVVDDLDMAFLFNLQNKMLPGNVLQRTLRISSVCFEDGDYHVMWSYSAATPDTIALPPLEVEDVPIEIMPSMALQDVVILIEISGSWAPQFLNVGLHEMRWNNALVTRPRFVKYIPHTTRNPANVCPSGGA